ncbi:MAG TPA: hypothetical protein VEL07_07085 [Planctomycetota bacterium]|nr:hypothetical protein [Planctomycetota bacterium]
MRRTASTVVSMCFLIVGAALPSGCGGGGGGGAGGAGPAPSPTVARVAPAARSGGVVAIDYDLAGGGRADVRVEVSLDGGASWFGAAPADGCATTKARSAPGAYVFTWDAAADGVAGQTLLRLSTGASSLTAPVVVPAIGWPALVRSATVDAAVTGRNYASPHRGHYDLSPVALDYLADPGFAARARQVPVKSWRISVGRWEIGPVELMAPEPDAYARDPARLRASSREFYRGPPTIAGARHPANYRFDYLDQAIAAVVACGAEPFLCFDMMPFTLAANQDPNTADNLYPTYPAFSFSNGIRTSPPSDDAVYAEVVKHVVKHVVGDFADGLRQPLSHVEIGNEPDLVGPLAHAFWTGTSEQFTSMYRACAAALDAEFGASIRIGGGSFALLHHLEPAPTFMQRFLAGLGGSRLDFVGFHCYGDVPETAFVPSLALATSLRDAYRPGAALFCPEWGMHLDSGVAEPFQDMRAAVHHAKALLYFTVFDVALAHKAPLRDPLPGHVGILTTPPVGLKPAAYAFSAFEMLAATPALCAITSAVPADAPMLVAGRGDQGITAVFFHAKPPAGQIGRFTLSLGGIPWGTWIVDRHVLTDATVAIGDGLWHARSRAGAGAALAETISITEDTLVVLRIRPATVGAADQATAPGEVAPRGDG